MTSTNAPPLPSFPPKTKADALSLLAYPHWSAIEVSGEDAVDFIHAQLTNDFALLALDQPQLAGYCSVKGRLLASFIGFKTQSDREGGAITLTLMGRSDVVQAAMKRLQMFVLRARVKMRLLDGPKASFAPEQIALQHLAEIGSGICHITQALADQFVPQMLNYESIDGVSFKKGCYPGQEVVARSQFRGVTKRRTYLAELMSTRPMTEATEALLRVAPLTPVMGPSSTEEPEKAEEVGVVLQAQCLTTDATRALALLCLFTSHAERAPDVLWITPTLRVRLMPLPYGLKQDI